MSEHTEPPAETQQDDDLGARSIAAARNYAESIRERSAFLAGWDAALAARPSADTETLRRVRGLLSPNGIPLHDSKVIKAGDIRAALDGTA